MTSTSKSLLRIVKDHPIGTVAVGGGVVAGVILVRRATKTAARVATIHAAAQAATDVAKALLGSAGTPTPRIGTAKSPRTRKQPKTA